MAVVHKYLAAYPDESDSESGGSSTDTDKEASSDSSGDESVQGGDDKEPPKKKTKTAVSAVGGTETPRALGGTETPRAVPRATSIELLGELLDDLDDATTNPNEVEIEDRILYPIALDNAFWCDHAHVQGRRAGWNTKSIA